MIWFVRYCILAQIRFYEQASGKSNMPRPRIYRDPIHGQIKFRRVDLSSAIPDIASPDERLGWLIPKLINCPEFQRLRHIRQNGLTNFIFHGAEHSRFAHSMGVSYLSGEMYNRVIENMGESTDHERRLATGYIRAFT